MRYLIAVILAVATLASPLWAAVKIQEVTSPGGITAWLVQEPSIPIISVELGFEGGTSLDEIGKEGAVYLMAGLLEEGTGELNFADFQRETERLAADFAFDAGKGSLTISATVLRSNYQEAFDLLKQAINAPAFNQVAIDRVRDQVLSILQRNAQDPSKIAGEALNRTIYGTHPYARPREGSIEAVAALTRDDLLAAHRNALAKDRLRIGVVGDISPQELGLLLDDLLGDLPQEGAQLPQYATYLAEPRTDVIDYASPQSIAIWAQKGIKRDHEDFFAAFILNHIIGGGSFTSRLTEEVREKRGLTYGIYTFLASGEYGDFYGGQVASANEGIAQAIQVIRDQWARLADEGVSAEELEDAKRFLTGAYPLRFDGNARIAGILTGMQMTDLPIDYIDSRNDRINAVSLEEINAFAKRFLDPESLYFVVVGQPEGL